MRDTLKRIGLGCALLLSGLASGWAGDSLTLIYSGNLDGELEPCGCSAEGNFGGIKRRATLLAQLRKTDPDIVVLSAGGLLSSDGAGDRLKSEYILKGFAQLGYDAVGVQWRDLAYGPEFIRQAELPWVSSNWAGPVLTAQRIVERAEQALAFYSWLDPEQSPLRQMQGSHQLAQDSPTALQRALREAHRQGWLTVLASSLSAEDMAQRMGLDNVDIYIERAAYEVYGEPRKLGQTLILQPGSRGMRLGRLELDIDAGRIRDWRHRVLPMPDSLPDAPELAAWYEKYNTRVKAEYLKRVEARKQQSAGQSPFVGEETCQTCHTAQHKMWAESNHALAYDNLEAVGKAFDPACLQCHTVGFDQPGGFFDMDITGHLLGVQCESCHGAGRAHAESAGAETLPNAGWRREQICAQCHTQPHSPSFELNRYWPKIAH
jgi:2',3'-cyclic-nucleotide 2'-phosphodiesterase (5'-nucleotidase family)